MKKTGLLFLGAIMLISCSKDNEQTMFVKAKVKGLKKGTFYLQKQVDSTIVSVDSVSVNGNDHFLMTDNVQSPEMYYLTMANSSKRIAFFGEKDTVNISTQLDRFDVKANISGSENQELLNNHYEMLKKFNNQKLDLIKEELIAKKSGNTDSIEAVNRKLKGWERKKYLYTTNFAINNSDFEVAPYVALTELTNANIGLLDTISKAMTPKVRASKYGVQLEEFVNEIKKTEQ
jgi:RecG-like helicase